MKSYLLLFFIAGKLLASPIDGVASLGENIELNESEKLIFKNQKDIRSNKRDLVKIKLQLNSIKESVEGLKSIVESTNSKIFQTTKRSNDSVSSKEISELKRRISAIEKDNDKRFKKIEASIQRLIKLLSKEPKSTKLKPPKESGDAKVKKSKKVAKKLSAKKAFQKAETLYKKRKYKEALTYYVIASKKKYNLPTTYFKMGESFYRQKKYEEAIVYYKKSVNAKDDSKFLPTLMLHTGISFKNIGDKEGARKFLEAVTGGFPKSNEAKIAKKILKKL